MSKNCFLNQLRSCNEDCVAYSGGTRPGCRILSALEKLVPVPTRPVAPPPPKVNR